MDYNRIKQLTDRRVLRERVIAACGSGSRRVVVGFALEGKIACAAAHPVHPAADADDEMVALGCCTKLLTIALIRQAFEEGRIHEQSELCGLLSGSTTLMSPRLRGISVGQLLEHTHGLNVESLDAAPLLPDGSIDSQALCSRAAASAPLAAPGRLYSYNATGAWLAAAILERMYGASFAHLLRERLFKPLGIDAGHCGQSPSPTHVCSSMGGGLAMTVRGFMQFLCAEANHEYMLRVARGETRIVRMPGFASLIQGVTLGWNHYESGWLGHASTLPSMLATARVHPERRIAIFVASDGPAPGAILARVFGDVLPDVMRYRMPPMRGTATGEPLDWTRYVGSWGDERNRIDIVRSAENQLELRWYWAQVVRDEPLSIATLVPAARELFLLRDHAWRAHQFIQYLEPGDCGFEFLWNGSSVWRHLDHGGAERGNGAWKSRASPQ